MLVQDSTSVGLVAQHSSTEDMTVGVWWRKYRRSTSLTWFEQNGNAATRKLSTWWYCLSPRGPSLSWSLSAPGRSCMVVLRVCAGTVFATLSFSILGALRVTWRIRGRTDRRTGPRARTSVDSLTCSSGPLQRFAARDRHARIGLHAAQAGPNSRTAAASTRGPVAVAF